MVKLHFSSKRFSLIKIFVLRGFSGFLPVIIAFILPLITDVEFGSRYFQKFSQAIILSSVLKLGLDQTILKFTSSYNELKNLLLLVFISHLVVFLVFVFVGFEFKIVVYGAFFISINSVISAFYLTNDFKIRAVVYQFILPNVLILGLSALRINPILVVSVAYGSILTTLFTREFINSSFEVANDLLIKQFVDNLPLIGYNVLGVLVMNAPIALSHYYITDSEVISLYKMLKIFSLSSFISMIIIFTFNNDLRNLKSTANYFRYVRNYTPIIVLLFFGVMGLTHYGIVPYSFSLLSLFMCSIILYFVMAGNVAGHYIILKSFDITLFKIMLFTLSITLTLLIVLNDFSVLYLFGFYAITTFVESVLKIKFLWKHR